MSSIFRVTGTVPAKFGTRRARKRSALTVLVALLVAAASWYGYDWWTVGRFLVSTDDAYVGGDVTVIAPKVAGLITTVAVGDNQAVRAGDLLVKLDDRDYRASLAKGVAAVAAERAMLADLDATRNLQQAVVAEAEAGVAAANAAIGVTRDDEVRYRALSGAAITSVQSFQKADAAYQEALASGARASAVLAAARRQIAVIEARKNEVEAALAEAIAARDLARLNLGYTELRAPIDGIVGNRSARVGAYASVGTELLSLVPARGLWVDANFKESQLDHIKPGMPATIEADALPGQVLHGEVASLAPATGAVFSILPPENATGNFTKIVQRVPVRIRLDGDAAKLGRLRPGLSVTVTVDTRSAGTGSR